MHGVITSTGRARRALGAGSTREQRDSIGERERCELVHDFTVDIERNLAGAQDAQRGSGVEEPNRECGGGVDDVLAVVENDQRAAALETLEQRRFASHIQRGNQGVDHIVGR